MQRKRKRKSFFKNFFKIVQITVADVLRHEAGLPRLSEQIGIEDCFSENIKKNSIGKIIEKEKLNFPMGNFRYIQSRYNECTYHH